MLIKICFSSSYDKVELLTIVIRNELIKQYLINNNKLHVFVYPVHQKKNSWLATITFQLSSGKADFLCTLNTVLYCFLVYNKPITDTFLCFAKVSAYENFPKASLKRSSSGGPM